LGGGKTSVKSNIYTKLLVGVFTIMLFAISSIYNPTYSRLLTLDRESEGDCPSVKFPSLSKEQDKKMKNFFEDNFSNIYNIDVSYAKTQLPFLTNEQLTGLICNWRKKHRDLERVKIKMQMQELKKSAD
jgi:hypothetical protein